MSRKQNVKTGDPFACARNTRDMIFNLPIPISDEPVRMPWLHLIDPKTGGLPKNYQEILDREEEMRKQRDPKSIKPDGNPNEEAGNSARPTNKPSLPSVTTGESEEKPNVNKSKGEDRKVSITLGTKLKKQWSYSELNVGKMNNIKTFGMEMHPEKCVRKKLFKPTPEARKSFKSRKNKTKESFVKPRTPNDSLSEGVRVIEDTKGDSSAISFEKDSSVVEFVQLETQLQTPRQNAVEPEEVSSPTLRDTYIERFAEIVAQQTKQLEEMKEILGYLRTTFPKSTSEAVEDDDKENVPVIMIKAAPPSISNCCKNDKSKIDTPKKTVSFSINAEKVEKALHWYDDMKNSCGVLQTPKFATPKRMKQHLSNKVQLQCLMLQDTPKRE